MLLKEIKSLLNEVIKEVLNEEDSDESKDQESQEKDDAEDEKSIVSLDKTQQLNAIDLEKVAKNIADELDKSYQNISEDKINDTINKPMGSITSNTINSIQKIPITTSKGKMKIIPLNVATEKETSSDNRTGAVNLDRYSNFQIIPFVLENVKGETVTGGKGKDEYVAIFLAPAVYAIIKEENIQKHEALFKFKHDKEKGQFYHSKIFNVYKLMVAESELKNIKASFKAGNFTASKSIINKQAQRKATNPSQKPGQDSK